MVALNLMMIFYPFRLFCFISRFNFASSVRGMLSAIVRMTPAICTYMTIVLFMGICVSTSSMLLLGPIIPEMSTFIGAMCMTLTVNPFELASFRDLMHDSNQMYYPIFGFYVNILCKLGTVIFIALVVYLFSHTVNHETIAVENEDAD